MTTLPIMKRVFGVERNVEDVDFPSEEEIDALEKKLSFESGGNFCCTHGWFPSVFEQKQLHYRKWLLPSTSNVIDDSNTTTPQRPKAIVIFMHGISTHAVKYITAASDSTTTTTAATTPNSNRKVSTIFMIESLLKENIVVYAFDLYGHGYSEGIRYYIPGTYQNNVQDYINFCTTIVSVDNVSNYKWNVPIFLLGESYGCTLTLHVTKYFQEHSTELPHFQSIILMAPAIIGDVPIYPVVQLLILLGTYYPTWRPFFMPNPVSPNRIWRDPIVLQQYMDKSLPQNKIDGAGIPFRLGTGIQLLKALEDVRTKVIPTITTPVCIIHGTKDYGVPISGSDLLFTKCLSTDKKFHRKDGAYHDLLADFVAEECMSDIITWINERI